MITTFLVDHQWIAPTALLIMVLVGPIAGRWLLGRPQLAWWAFSASLVPVALLTLTPVHRELFSQCEVEWSLPTPTRAELAANVVLFVLPVMVGAIACRRPFLAFFAGSAAAAGIESVQAVLTGMGRSCSTNDWLSNTVGAAIGAALAWVSLAWARRAATTDLPTGGRA